MFDPLTISANWLVLVLREYFVEKKQKQKRSKNESATNDEENQL